MTYTPEGEPMPEQDYAEWLYNGEGCERPDLTDLTYIDWCAACGTPIGYIDNGPGAGWEAPFRFTGDGLIICVACDEKAGAHLRAARMHDAAARLRNKWYRVLHPIAARRDRREVAAWYADGCPGLVGYDEFVANPVPSIGDFDPYADHAYWGYYLPDGRFCVIDAWQESERSGYLNADGDFIQFDKYDDRDEF